MSRLAFALTVLGFALLPSARAQVPKLAPVKEQPLLKAVKRERVAYPVRGGDPATMAEIVSTHFKGEVVASFLANTVVLSGEHAAVQEAIKLLEQVDHPARTVEVELVLIDLPKADAVTLPTAADVLSRLDELGKAGAAVQRIKLTAVEGQAVMTQTGGNKPFTTSSVTGGRGAAPGGGGFGGPTTQRSVSYQPTGTTVRATARVGADQAVTLELNVQESGMKPGEAADDPPAMETSSLTTQVKVPPGQGVLAQAIRKDAKASKSVTLVIVTAKVIEAKGTK